MSTLSYYEVTIPVFIKSLENLRAFFEKGAQHAKETGETEEAFLNRTLAPDMFPLKRQIQIATDNAKGLPTRLTGAEALVIEDTETTVAELIARIDRVIAHLRTFTPEQFGSAATAEIRLPYFPDKVFLGRDYLLEFGLPNFFFHITTAYAIIRNSGIPLGKMDFLGSLTTQPQ